ncbi:MAG: outer membrane protein assembly factor BamE [Rhodospirillaceae bacterium]|nr:outer membrane protein assembly factor BamE [Rhodospirillaceae bacterium]
MHKFQARSADPAIARPRRGRFALIGTLCLLAAACGGKYDVRGNEPDPDKVLAVHPGIDTRQQVSQLLGTPSTTSTFDPNTWYYISKRTEQYAFFDPDIIDQEVLVVKFDDGGLVSDMYIYGVEDGRIVEPVERTTPTYGQELTLMQQLIGNFGRFNTE